MVCLSNWADLFLHMVQTKSKVVDRGLWWASVYGCISAKKSPVHLINTPHRQTVSRTLLSGNTFLQRPSTPPPPTIHTSPINMCTQWYMFLCWCECNLSTYILMHFTSTHKQSLSMIVMVKQYTWRRTNKRQIQPASVINKNDGND